MSAGKQLRLLSQRIQQGSGEALAELTQLASTPNKYQALAALRLGLLHDRTGPMGCLNDLQEALRYYRLAADLGNPEQHTGSRGPAPRRAPGTGLPCLLYTSPSPRD